MDRYKRHSTRTGNFAQEFLPFMEYAIQLLLPILGGLLLGIWLTENYGVSPIWTVILAVLGMVGGIGILYKRFSYPELYPDSKKTSENQISKVRSRCPNNQETIQSATQRKNDTSAKSSAKSVPIDQLNFLYEEPDHNRNREEFDFNLDDEQPETDKPEKESP